jgi:hypothetical protein
MNFSIKKRVKLTYAEGKKIKDIKSEIKRSDGDGNDYDIWLKYLSCKIFLHALHLNWVLFIIKRNQFKTKKKIAAQFEIEKHNTIDDYLKLIYKVFNLVNVFRNITYKFMRHIIK